LGIDGFTIAINNGIGEINSAVKIGIGSELIGAVAVIGDAAAGSSEI
jgi:hypothetical protein